MNIRVSTSRARLHSTARAVALLSTSTLACTLALPAYADCGASNTPAQARAHYQRGLQLEKQKPREALAAFVAAQEYTCESNPVEADAARRAAALAKPLAAAAEQKSDLQAAYRYYEDGGLFADADRVLLAQVRGTAADPTLWDRAREHFANRASPAFQANEKVRLGTIGSYTADPRVLPEILAMPAKRHAATLALEETAFDVKYLQQLVATAQSLPPDPLDAAAMARLQQQAQANARRWPQDPLEQSRKLLGLARDWSNRTPDGESATLEKQTRARYELRARTLATQYSGAPQALEAAMDYHRAAAFGDPAVVEPAVAALRRQASGLGAAAEKAGKLELAAQYYGVADDDARAVAAREKMRQQALAKLQPQIDQAQRDAEALAKRFSDREQVEALQRQAEAAKAALEKQKQSGRASQQGNDAFAKELGL
jgi:hypothetical protein